MAEFHLVQSLLPYWHVILAGALLVYGTRTYFNRGLNRYPGPFVANFTNAWRAWYVWRSIAGSKMIEVHKRYGPIVRTGPNTIEIADPTMIPHIYGVNKGYNKSDFYEPFISHRNGRPVISLFPTRDERMHKELRRPVAAMYSLSGVSEYEPLVDEMIRLFTSRLNEELAQNKSIDLGDWLHYLAADMILYLNFNNTFGFLEKATDAGGFIKSIAANVAEGSVCAQMPWTRYLWRHNPISGLFRDTSIFPALVQGQLKKHKEVLEAEKSAHAEKTTVPEQKPMPGLGAYGADFMTRCLKLPNLSDPQAVAVMLSTVIAGSDTVAGTLCSIVYFLLRDPPIMTRLLGEIQSAKPSFPVTWKESQQMPYLRAVIEEGLRLRPSVAMALLRDVPDGPGLELPDGSTVPAGAAVGMNAWAVHQDMEVFGPLPTDKFRPKRWLKAEGESLQAYEDRVATMRRLNLTFGYPGSKRVCIGRHIAALEMYKVLPSLLSQFDIELENPQRELKVIERFVVHPKGLVCRMKHRELLNASI